MMITSMFTAFVLVSSSLSASPQELVGAIQWGFESPLPHQQKRDLLGIAASRVSGIVPGLAPTAASELQAATTPERDPVLDAVLVYFSADEVARLPRIVMASIKPDRVAKNAEGFTVPGYPAVYLATWSEAYRAAQGGDRVATMKLAGVLAHEAMHVTNGPSEAPAYRAEIAMLRRVGAPSSVIDGVIRAMRAVTKNEA